MEKKVEISILERKREFKMEKKGRNFHFWKKRVQNGKNSRNFHFGNKKRVQNGKNSQNFHFGIKV